MLSFGNSLRLLLVVCGISRLPIIRGDCGALPELENGYHNLTAMDPPYPVNTKALYTCNRGYTRSGYPMTVCLESGSWSDFPMPLVCNINSCSDPGRPPHGSKDSNLYSIGSLVTYICDDGYELVGRATIQCLITSDWNSPRPTCQEIQCPALQDPTHGRVMGTSRTYGSTVSLECDRGYASEGPATATCQLNKSWTNQPFTCQEIDCGPVPSLPNANLDLEGGTGFGEPATFSCFANATSSTANSDAVIFCGNEGVWITDHLPDCFGCCSVAQNVADNSVPFIAGGSCIPHGESRHSSGFSCAEGFYLEDPSRQFTCNNGSMTLHGAQCSEIRCSIPAVKYGKVSGLRVGDSVGYNEVMTVECDAGAKVSPSNTVKCGINTTFPTCRYDKCVLPVPQDFDGWFESSSGRKIQEKSIEHGTTIRVICKEGYVMLPGQKKRQKTTCNKGDLELTPCEEAPCPLSVFPGVSSSDVEADCLVQGDYVQPGCVILITTDSDKQQLQNATCEYGKMLLVGKNPMTDPPKTENKNQLYVLFVIPVVAVLLAVGGFFAWKHHKKNDSEKKKRTGDVLNSTESVQLKSQKSAGDSV